MKNLHLFKNLIDIMPTLSQVQTYIKNRISAIGNNNNINELKQFLESIRYDPEKTADDLFPFGVQLGNGSDEEHFHLGFTGVKLLERLKTFKNSGSYHIDATYKIVKYCYPLIVFGFTNIKREFFPVAFMFTINALHCCTCVASYKILLQTTLAKWKKTIPLINNGY